MSKTKKSVKLNATAQIDGKATEPGNNEILGSLDQIMGESVSIYKSRTVDDYVLELAEMNQTDIQAHAYKVGLVPIDDRKVLVERLTLEFRKWLSSIGAVQKNFNNNPNGMNESVRKILREGA
jgi:hypothetical protein